MACLLFLAVSGLTSSHTHTLSRTLIFQCSVLYDGLRVTDLIVKCFTVNSGLLEGFSHFLHSRLSIGMSACCWACLSGHSFLNSA